MSRLQTSLLRIYGDRNTEKYRKIQKNTKSEGYEPAMVNIATAI